MTADEKIQYEYWFTLLRNILLRDRSDFMVRNLHDKRLYSDARFAILVCGAGHTPFREEYGPYSVLKMLRALPVNYIIAIVPSAFIILNKRQPFDFYTPADKSEVGPYYPHVK